MLYDLDGLSGIALDSDTYLFVLKLIKLLLRNGKVTSYNILCRDIVIC